MPFILKVPVKPHVKKYLVENYGEIYKLTLRDAIGVAFFQMARQPIGRQVDIDRVNKFSEQYTISLERYYKHDRGCNNFSDETMVQFNSFIEEILLTEFYLFVENLECFGIEQKEAIASFMAKYEMDESDIKFDTLKKSYQRYSNKRLAQGKRKLRAMDTLPIICIMRALSTTYGNKQMIKKSA